MKEFFTCTIGLLRKHKRLWVVNLAFVAMFLISIYSILLAQPELTVICFFLLIMISWEISDVFLFEKQSILQTELADTKDKLCLSEHEVDKLKFELGTLQAALKEEEKRRGQASKKAKETANKTDETTPVAEQKTKRPAFKRKPKLKTDTPDENKN